MKSEKTFHFFALILKQQVMIKFGYHTNIEAPTGTGGAGCSISSIFILIYIKFNFAYCK